MFALNKTGGRNLTILVGSTTTVLAATIISPILPQMTSEFADIPNVDLLVRLSLTMPALFVAISAPFAGLLLDRVGRKPVLIVALLLYAIAGSAGFILESLPAILVSRAVLGLAVAGIMSGFTTLVLDYFEGGNLTRFLGYQGAFIGLGGMVFLSLAGFLAEIDWRLPFLIHLFALIVLPAVIFLIDEPERKVRIAQETTTGQKPKFPWRALAPVYATAFITMLIFFIFPVQLPFYLTEVGTADASQVGVALSIQTLSSVVIALQYHRLKSRFSFFTIFALILLTLSINHLILGLTAEYIWVVVALLIGGIGIGLIPPNLNTWLASVVSDEVRGRAVGGSTSILFLGQFLTPIVTQPLVNQFGLAGMFIVMGVFALVLAGVFTGAAVKQSANNPVINAES